MAVTFSCPHPFNAQGPSRPLTRIHNALAQRYGHDYVAYHPGSFDHILKDIGRLGDAIGPAFDDLAADAQSGPFTDGMFLGGGGASLNQIRHYKPSHNMHGSVRCGTLWFSSHWAYAQRILKEEYAAWGATNVEPIHPYVAWRAWQEQRWSDYIIVPSKACASTYPAELQTKIHVAEFGVDTTDFRPGPRKPINDSLRVLFPATNPYRKGLRSVIAALRAIPREKVQTTMTGSGLDYNAELNANGPRILTPGWVSAERMHLNYRSHDVLLLPSLEEGQALAALEGMASGMPLIVTPNVGIEPESGYHLDAEAFSKQPWGLIVKPRDDKGLQAAIQYCIDNPTEVRQMGLAARASAESRTWEKFTNRVIDIMEANAA